VDESSLKDRRRRALSDAEERIAQRAAEIVKETVALQIGNGVLKMAFYLIGAAAFAVFVWMTGRELFK
jgi:hypothetical protein